MANNNPILDEYSTIDQINKESNLTQIEVQRGIGSYFPIFVSLGITLYGFFLFLQTIVDTQYVIYGTLAFLGVLLVYIEHHRADLISDWLGSRLEKLVNKLATIPTFGFMVGIGITILFIALDTWGAMQSADSIERMLVSGIVKNSEQYKIEQKKAKSGVNEAKEYQKQLSEWRKAKREHYNGCNQSWKVPKYRTKNQLCKDKFTEKEPTEIKSSGGTIAVNTYTEMEDKAKEEVAGYRKMFFWVFLGFSILLNYFAMASLFNQYRKKRKELTPDVLDELADRMELMNAEKLNKLSMSTKAQKKKLEEKNIIDVEIEKETYNIVIAKRAKVLSRKKEIPLRIVNNEHLMEQQKAGMVHNPFNQSDKMSNQQRETKEEMIKRLGLVKVEDYYNNHGVNYAYLYKGYLIHYPYGETIITKPLNGEIKERNGNLALINYNRDERQVGKYEEISLEESVKIIDSLSVKRNNQTEPLNGEHKNRAENDQPLNDSVITDRKETKPLNDSVKRIDLKGYSNDDLKLIDLLWKYSTVKRNEQLETRDNVLKIIGDNKNNTLRLRNLYKKLLADKYIYKKVSYFSDVDL